MELDLNQKIERAIRAGEVLEHPLFIEAIETLKQELTQQWEQSPARDVEGREKLYLMLKLTDKVKANLQSIVETGKFAQMEQTRLQKMMEAAKESVGWD